MKKLNIFVVLVLCLSSLVEAQTKADFGVKGGINLTFFNVTEASFGDSSETATGVYIGVFADIDFNQNLRLQPELLYISLNDFKFINVPIYLSYNASNKVSILVGPSLNYFFDFFSNKFKIRVDLGFAYNISSKLDTHVKYTLGFQEITPNGLFLGIGYKL